MFTTYYINAIVWVFLIMDVLAIAARKRRFTLIAAPIGWTILGILLGMTPHLIVKTVLFGVPWDLNYGVQWFWTSPRLVQVLVSPNHGLWLWTPVVCLACVGWLAMFRLHAPFAWRSVMTFLGFWYVVASVHTWHGISSFSNRFFLSLTPLFVVGLAAFLAHVRAFLEQRTARPWLAHASIAALLIGLILWNIGFVFQWATNMVPNRGPVSFVQVARNQFTIVPQRMWTLGRAFLLHRWTVIRAIEQEDIQEARRYRPRR